MLTLKNLTVRKVCVIYATTWPAEHANGDGIPVGAAPAVTRSSPARHLLVTCSPHCPSSPGAHCVPWELRRSRPPAALPLPMCPLTPLPRSLQLAVPGGRRMVVRVSPRLSRGPSPCRCGHRRPVSFLHSFLALLEHRTIQGREAFGHCRPQCWPVGKTRGGCGAGRWQVFRGTWGVGLGATRTPLLAASVDAP